MSVKRTFLSVWGMILAGVVWAQPRLAVDRDVANMGEIMFQLPSKVNFTLRNTGTDPLSITEVIPSCGCTAVDWTRELIAPGAEGTITAIYDAKMLGVFQKDLEVYTNASSRFICIYKGVWCLSCPTIQVLFPSIWGMCD